LSTLRNRHIGFVFQQFHLLPLLDVVDNVCMPLMYRDDVTDDAMRRTALELVTRVGLGSHARHRPSQLSGGQQQRVAIARALAGNPALLLADEPTGALDTKTAGEIMALFREINREQGITIVYVTHDPNAAEYADRTVRIRDGRLVDDRVTA
jgi:putative ABC transport system ATP-binding protein